MRWTALLLLLSCSLFGQSDRANFSEGFDRPLRTTVVDLGASMLNPPFGEIRKSLTCFSYATFTVKEYDEGQKGAEWLSIVHSGQAECTQRHVKDERVYTYPEWSGYFWGAVGEVAFFTAPDGDSGGLPFAAFDIRTGQKLFQDSVLLDHYREQLYIDVFHISSGADHVLQLTYFRVVQAGCDLKAEQAGCWKKVRGKLGIAQTHSPVCSGYEQANARWESAVAYPVFVRLADSPHPKSVDGPVFCWPVD